MCVWFALSVLWRADLGTAVSAHFPLLSRTQIPLRTLYAPYCYVHRRDSGKLGLSVYNWFEIGGLTCGPGYQLSLQRSWDYRCTPVWLFKFSQNKFNQNKISSSFLKCSFFFTLSLWILCSTRFSLTVYSGKVRELGDFDQRTLHIWFLSSLAGRSSSPRLYMLWIFFTVFPLTGLVALRIEVLEEGLCQGKKNGVAIKMSDLRHPIFSFCKYLI